MSWSARIAHTSTGLAIVFAGPVTRLDFTPDVAAHFARLLAAEASCPTVATTIENEKQALAATPLREQHALCCDCDHCLNGDPNT